LTTDYKNDIINYNFIMFQIIYNDFINTMTITIYHWQWEAAGRWNLVGSRVWKL